MTEPSIEQIFQKKYEEFANDLKDVFPELNDELEAALKLSNEERWNQYKLRILKEGGRPDRSTTECPGMVLPGVIITPDLWSGLSSFTKDAIQKYLSILTFSFILKDGPGNMNLNGDLFKEWADKFLGEWRSKMGRADFDSFAIHLAISVLPVPGGPNNSKPLKINDFWLTIKVSFFHFCYFWRSTKSIKNIT